MRAPTIGLFARHTRPLGAAGNFTSEDADKPDYSGQITSTGTSGRVIYYARTGIEVKAQHFTRPPQDHEIYALV